MHIYNYYISSRYTLLTESSPGYEYKYIPPTSIMVLDILIIIITMDVQEFSAVLLYLSPEREEDFNCRAQDRT